MIIGHGVALQDRGANLRPNKPMKLTVACGALSLSAWRSLGGFPANLISHISASSILGSPNTPHSGPFSPTTPPTLSAARTARRIARVVASAPISATRSKLAPTAPDARAKVTSPS